MELKMPPSSPPKGASAEGPLYASVDGLVAALSNEECVFQHAETGESHVMTVDVLAAMDACHSFRSLAEHVDQVERKLPALKGKRQAIEQVLGFLIKRGLMTSDQAMLERLRASAMKAQAPPVALTIRSCDRPAQLAPLLASIETYEARFSRGLAYVVIDDSRDAANVRRNGEAVAALRSTGIAAHHLDRDWRARLSALCEREAELDGRAGSLLGLERSDEFTGGAASNAALLLTAGSRLLQLDDDFLIQPRRRPGGDRGIGLKEPLHVPISFEPGLEALDESLEAVDGDPLAAHVAACGQPAGALFGPEFELEIGPDAWRGVSFKTARAALDCDAIKTTAGGVWGDSRMDTTLWYYLLPGQCSRGMWSDQERYRSLLHRPTMAHGFDRVQLARLSNFTPVGVDNTELTPCLPPTGRGEDYAFAAWMRYLYPRSLTVHMPAMLRHERPAGPAESPHAHAYLPWFSRFAGEYALSHLDACQASGAAQRVDTLIALYRDLAAASPTTRIRVLREFLAYMRAQIIQQMQQALTNLQNPPDYWLADAREWINENGKALTERRAPRLRDWGDDLDEAACGDTLARELERCAAALESWPRLWRLCRDRFDELVAL